MRVFKGLPRNKLSNLVGWAFRPPKAWRGQDVHPTRKIVCFFIWKSLIWNLEFGAIALGVSKRSDVTLPVACFPIRVAELAKVSRICI
ncbi:hypothetical protein FACHB389_09990 [Nostoc calcicola FACHB-389]|nr:hypothetical protein FACHB389_09990 [Nostoc calcicola FACHB-389]